MIYSELPDEGNPSMTCVNERCCEFLDLYSASRGDYFWRAGADVVVCTRCGQPMRLARSVTTVEVL